MGLGIVTAALVGRAIGGNQVRTGKIKAVVSVVSGFLSQLAFAIPMLAFANILPRIYTKDPHTLEVIHGCWYIFIAMRLLGGIVGSYQGIITGLGMQMTAFYVSILSFYPIGLPLSYLLGF